jgi:hypothetical protein
MYTRGPVSENARPPVAIRIVRPYATEEEFFEHELETVGKTSVILIGAHARPTGVILRFEVTLSTGATILRGEGRVLAHKESAFRGQPGLSLRFTRLDPRSKALVDKATAMREARSGDSTSGRLSGRPSAPPARPSAPPPPPPSPAPPPLDLALAAALTADTPPPVPAHAPEPPSSDEHVEAVTAEPPTSVPPSSLQPIVVASPSTLSLDDLDEAPTHVETRSERPLPYSPRAAPPPFGSQPPPPLPSQPPPQLRTANGDPLARLRERARALTPDRIAAILAKKTT